MSKRTLDSWKLNAIEWNKAIDEKSIKSREITNPAIVNTLLDFKPSSLLDVGCGEGWLVRKLNNLGVRTEGVDATPELIDIARSKGDETYFVATYRDIVSNSPDFLENEYGTAVFNFSIYEKEIYPLLSTLHQHLVKEKRIIIQTLNPNSFFDQDTVEGRYEEDSWKGLTGNFRDPHSWYAKTRSEWEREFQRAGLRLVESREPGIDGSPLSIILVLE